MEREHHLHISKCTLTQRVALFLCRLLLLRQFRSIENIVLPFFSVHLKCVIESMEWWPSHSLHFPIVVAVVVVVVFLSSPSNIILLLRIRDILLITSFFPFSLTSNYHASNDTKITSNKSFSPFPLH